VIGWVLTDQGTQAEGSPVVFAEEVHRARVNGCSAKVFFARIKISFCCGLAWREWARSEDSPPETMAAGPASNELGSTEIAEHAAAP
jgi:hypothetical protein